MPICALLLAVSAALPAAQEDAPPTLVVPEGFVAELLLEAPAIRWPSAVHALRDGSLLVAEDPMDMPGPSNDPLDRILRLTFAADGSVAGTTVFAEGLYAAFGIAQVDEHVLVMNMPYLTRLTDRDGDGVAEERSELVSDLGPPAPGWPGGFNDHIVSGIRLGIDGWLYVAVGDKGIPRATGRDGSTLTLRGGGVIRLRPDGTRLEVVARGLRNVLDVAIDEEGELFTYDNTDDGLGWWTRVTHVVRGGEYGYPWLYHDHQDRMLPAMAEYGGGSPTGGLVLSRAWPAPYGGSLLFCEWGDQALRRFEVERDGATFRVTHMEELAKAGLVPNFRPTDVCESVDGRQLFVADWGHGGWTADDVTGRLWRIRRADDPPLATALEMPAEFLPGMEPLLSSPVARVRLEAQRRALAKPGTFGTAAAAAIRTSDPGAWSRPEAFTGLWFLALRGEERPDLARLLLDRAMGDGPAAMRAQACRALGELADLRLDDLDLIALDDPRVRREAWRGVARSARAKDAQERGRVAARLFDAIGAEADPWVRIPLEQALRELDAWSFVAGEMLDRPQRIGLRNLGALRGAFDPFLVLGLHAVVRHNDDADVRREAGGLLGETYKRPEPWDGVWWGTQPARTAPPAHTLAWEETENVGHVLASWLQWQLDVDGASPRYRAAGLEGIRRARDAELGAALIDGVRLDGDAREAEATLRLLAELKTDASRLVREALESDLGAGVRAAAIELALAVRSDGMASVLERVARSDEAGDARARALEALAEMERPAAAELCRAELASPDAAVRRAGGAGLGRVGVDGAVAELLRLVNGDGDGAGANGVAEAAVRALARHPRADALAAYLAGIGSPQPGVREACRQAIVAVRDDVRAEVERRAAAGELSTLATLELRKAYSGLAPVVRWEVLGPFAESDVPHVELDPEAAYVGADASAGPLAWTEALGAGEHGRVELNARLTPNDRVSAFARATVVSPRARRAEIAVGSDDQIAVWLDGALVFHHDDPRGWAPDDDRFEVDLREGANALLVRVDEVGGDWAFSVKVALEGTGPLFTGELDVRSEAELAAFAARLPGDAARGRAIFFDAIDGGGPGCMRCHVVRGEGTLFGPNLSDVGARYDRAFLIRAVLEPSANVESHYRGIGFELRGGRLASGLVLSEDAAGIVLVDAAGTKTVLEPRGRRRSLGYRAFRDAGRAGGRALAGRVRGPRRLPREPALK